MEIYGMRIRECTNLVMKYLYMKEWLKPKKFGKEINQELNKYSLLDIKLL